jgi:hypothetical protein
MARSSETKTAVDEKMIDKKNKPKKMSKHRIYVPCKDCTEKILIPIEQEKGTIECVCGWKMDYVIEDEGGK